MLTLPIPAVATILLLTAGVGLIAVEFNRPGSILPGALGLIGVLIATASMTRLPHEAHILVPLVLFPLILLIDVRKPHILFAIGAQIASLLGFCELAQTSSSAVALPLAIVCALAITVGTLVLNRIAHRARVNKGLD